MGRILLAAALIALSACETGAPKSESSRESGSSHAPAPAPKREAEVFRAADRDRWCRDLRAKTKRFGWAIDPCEGADWRSAGKSIEGRDLVYGEFGNPNAANRTLILSMVHPDEVTPLYLGLQLARWLKENPEALASSRVVVAPLVNPDGLYRAPMTRVNARGVDLNRNFMTRDWSQHALVAWKTKFRSNPRRYPGSAPESEPETVFQRELIARLKPEKILSIHAPLNYMDYDGPMSLTLERFPKEYVQECLKLRRRLKAVHSGFFPGSLGNYAGNELGIPTLTLELPTANPKQADAYWKRFKEGIRTAIEYDVPEVARMDSITAGAAAPLSR